MAEQPGTPPVMLLSAVASDIDRIVGLELGADDYMAKPFNPRELLARLRVVLRRGHAASARAAATPVLTFAGWVLDPTFYVVRDAAGRDVDLTSGEFKLLHALAAHAGQVVSREALLAWCTAMKPKRSTAPSTWPYRACAPSSCAMVAAR
jgi:two-component system OmpR family response regulator